MTLPVKLHVAIINRFLSLRTALMSFNFLTLTEQIFHPGELKVVQQELMKKYAPIKDGLNKKASVLLLKQFTDSLKLLFLSQADSPEGFRS